MTATETVGPEVIFWGTDIHKRYGGVHALKGVDFQVRPGTITTLFGENGAGKSTLMKILAGIEKPTSGTLMMQDGPVEFASSKEAVARGVAIVHQELNLAPNLSVSDNIFLGREMRNAAGVVDYATQRKRVRAVMERLGEDIDPDVMVSDLRIGQQQIVEIASALLEDARVLIMDEPTSALSEKEIESLFRVVFDLRDKGVAIIYISHHLEEALHVADVAVVFRDGAKVASAPRSEVDMAWVIHNMVGGAIEAPELDDVGEPGEVLLSIKNLVVQDPRTLSRKAVDGVSIDVRAGESVCLYGLMGAGRTEMMECLAGRLPIMSGTVELEGEDISKWSIGKRIERGLGLVPEDRQRDGLIQTQSVGNNMMLSSLWKMLKNGFLHFKTEKDRIKVGMTSTRVKAASPNILVTSLSGGNQQKVAISRILLTDPRVILLDEPTRGIDVGAKAEIFALMRQQAEEGKAILFVTSEISEALTYSDRLIVMSRGKISGRFETRHAKRDDVMSAAGESVELVEEELNEMGRLNNG